MLRGLSGFFCSASSQLFPTLPPWPCTVGPASCTMGLPLLVSTDPHHHFHLISVLQNLLQSYLEKEGSHPWVFSVNCHFLWSFPFLQAGQALFLTLRQHTEYLYFSSPLGGFAGSYLTADLVPIWWWKGNIQIPRERCKKGVLLWSISPQ